MDEQLKEIYVKMLTLKGRIEEISRTADGYKVVVSSLYENDDGPYERDYCTYWLKETSK